VFLNAGQALGMLAAGILQTAQLVLRGFFSRFGRAWFLAQRMLHLFQTAVQPPDLFPQLVNLGRRVADIWRRDCSLASRALTISSRRRRSSASRSSISLNRESIVVTSRRVAHP